MEARLITEVSLHPLDRRGNVVRDHHLGRSNTEFSGEAPSPAPASSAATHCWAAPRFRGFSFTQGHRPRDTCSNDCTEKRAWHHGGERTQVAPGPPLAGRDDMH